MSSQANLLLKYAYATNIKSQAQQMRSALENTVARGMSDGESKRHHLTGKVSPVEITSRHQETPYVETPHDDRWTVMRKWAISDLFDTFDAARSAVGRGAVNGRYLRSQVAGMNRIKDEIILAALGGNAVTGKTGTGTQALPAAQQIAVGAHAFDEAAGSGDVGLTYYKLLNAKNILMGAYGALEGRRICCALPAKQLMALLASTKVSSDLYNQSRPLARGELNTFMGITFHPYEDSLIVTDGSSDELVYVYVDDAMQMDVTEELFTAVEQLPSHNYSTQIYASMAFGAGRMDDSGVVEIACDPGPTL